jgi:RNA polymerase sigma-70 factor (family 1)
MNAYLQISDNDLITLLADGDDAAFKEIYTRYSSLLFVYAYKKLQDKEEAKDVVQEVFTTLWTNRYSFVLKSTLAGYLYKSVLNKVLNIFRHKGFCDQYAGELQHLIGNKHATADYLVREKDISVLIEKEIAAFPPRMREVFELRRKQYLTNKSIAEQLGISEHTVATQMKKALKVLKVKFGVLMALLYFFS